MVLEDIELDLLNYVNYDFATKFNVLPIRRYNNGVIIICSEIIDKVINDLKIKKHFFKFFLMNILFTLLMFTCFIFVF